MVVFSLQMIHKWCSSLSNRTIIVTLVVCVLMLYISYTFNPCLVAKLQGSLRVSLLHQTPSERERDWINKILFVLVIEIQSQTAHAGYECGLHLRCCGAPRTN